MSANLAATAEKSSNRRHDKWLKHADDMDLARAEVVAVCSMWNAGYLPATIASSLRMDLETVARIIRYCGCDLRSR